MDSPHELIRLAAYKAAMSRDVARRRSQCAAAPARVAQPLAWPDRALAFWRRVSRVAKFAGVPLAILVQRAVLPRLKMLGAFMRSIPLVLGSVRGIGSAIKRD